MKNLNRNIVLLVVFSLSIFLNTSLFAQNDSELKKEREKKEMLQSKEQDIKRKQDVLKEEKKELKKESKEVKRELKEVKKDAKVQSEEPGHKGKPVVKDKRGIANDRENAKDRSNKTQKGPDRPGKTQADEDKALKDKKEGSKVGTKKPKLSADVEGKKGNAYGKKKAGLTGKDYGQQRAREAKMKQDELRAQHQTTLNSAKDRASGAREKIKEASLNLEATKKANKISEEDYKLKKEKILKAEEALKKLEVKVQKAEVWGK